ncbi:MAG: Epimerase family protein [Chlamydiia bacterium]|nr:Epimerase family protein [Chlamydiia bacterium]MCH9618799.1 Epimerase family protein [Chlamydiia bacterium]MCH9624608.1 Epimerase family protein [Chlamydiia bacterium]
MDKKQLDLFRDGEQRTVAITGISGMVGVYLKKHFIKKGWKVRSIKRGHLEDKGALLSILSEADVVINLAGENVGMGRWTEKKKDRIYQSRIGVTSALVEVLNDLKMEPKIFISASATGYYGSDAGDVENEECMAGKDFLAKVCVDWEKEAQKYQKGRVVITRFGAILSKEGGLLKKLLLLGKFCLGGVIGSGNQMLSWISIEDLTSVISLCIENEDIKGAINVTSPNPISNKELTRLMSKKLSRPLLLRMPEFLAKLFFGEKADALLLSNQSVMPKKLEDVCFTFRHKTFKELL